MCHDFSVHLISLHNFVDILEVLTDLDETSKRKVDILEHFIVSWMLQN